MSTKLLSVLSRLGLLFALVGALSALGSSPVTAQERGLAMHPDDVERERVMLEERVRILEQRLEALSHGTVGQAAVSAPAPSPRMVTPPGSYALSIDGDFELGGFVFKEGYPFLHNEGGYASRNTALGLDALASVTPGVPYGGSGKSNTALGFEALANNTSGRRNTGVGTLSLRSNTEGISNTANGAHALSSNTEGYKNTANGSFALSSNITGSNNTALGSAAGGLNTTGSNNIWIANYGSAAGATESNTLRIGEGTGTGFFQQNRAFISGIRNATLSGSGEHTVCVDDNDQLGVCSPSSARFKRDIREMGEASTGLEALRPVIFRYRPEVKEDAEPEQYGLIAEEVAEIYPHLVSTDAEGKPFAVRYDLLAPLLLNELQQAQDRITALEERLRRLEDVSGDEP